MDSPASDTIASADLATVWPVLVDDERLEAFRLLATHDAQDFFLELSALDQARLVRGFDAAERRLWLRLLPPDDAADLLQSVDPELREALLPALDDATRREVRALMAYAEDAAGGLMSPRYARARPDMSADEAIRYLRRQTQNNLETLYYVYVLDEQQHLLGVVSFRELFVADGNRKVAEVMHADPVKVREATDQETVARLFAQHDLMAVPVVDEQGRMKGIVTVDDIVDVVQEENTEDIQKLGGMAALEAPYLNTGLLPMVRKRAGWLAALFVGEMLTASAMGHYEDEIQRAVVLALFVPLIISSGGNSGSQATTLVIRAMALGEVRPSDLFRVLRRELLAGILLGAILAAIGMVRILAWQSLFGSYGEHFARVALTVGLSLIGVVLWGTVCGSMLPFLLKRLRFDPASASAPFVATLVDVCGLAIYFTMAEVVLRGTLL